uniref:Ovule protein n=1 Tax=Steinernema glaseri TaxID=37863 RepID=A0A1I7ZGN0_9BILA
MHMIKVVESNRIHRIESNIFEKSSNRIECLDSRFEKPSNRIEPLDSRFEISSNRIECLDSRFEIFQRFDNPTHDDPKWSPK